MGALELDGVAVRYGTGARAVDAVHDVSLVLRAGDTVGIVGESGSGKSTLARAIVGIAPVTRGRIALDGRDVAVAPRSGRRDVQMVFQDPAACLDPRMSVGQSIAEALAITGRAARAERRAQIAEALELVGLESGAAAAYPRELSGGQRQRVALARALAVRPRFLLADEITSALDVSVQGAVLNVLRDLQRRLGFGLLFISHDLAVVRYVADSLVVMRAGRVVETGTADRVLADPREAYTRQLVAAAPALVRAGL